ncbi:MAG: FAD-dependent oxidoreductase [Lentisphaerae bacterium]|nr:FAD-dependent oxidoreductase [Lentisphaerota bacterium]
MKPVYQEKDSRRDFFVALPDHDFYEDEVECRAGCPTRTDARGYLIETAKGNYEGAYAISRATNPFASICGVICGAPCETACRRGDVDQPLAIRNIKGFLTQRHGPETGDLKSPLAFSTARGNTTPQPNGKRVAVVGGGCAGMTCAHDLARMGYSVTVFERHPRLGGQLVQGVPINRLNRDVVQAECDSIVALGLVEVKTGIDIGKDLSLQELKEQFDAVFISVGLMAGKRLPFEHTDHKSIATAMEFLLDFNLYTPWDLTGKKVLVYGGGDTAMDAARSAVRCGAARVELACMEALWSRTLRGRRGNEQVCTEDELVGALEEGVILNGSSLPESIVVEDGVLRGLKMKKVNGAPHLVFTHAGGRLDPQVIDEDIRFVEADLMIWAVRQETDFSDSLKALGIAMTDRGAIQADSQTLMTSVDGIFAGGDIQNGGMLFIHAVAEGSRAALGIDAYLSQAPLHKRYREITWRDEEVYERDSGYLNTDWINREEDAYDPKHPRALQVIQEYSECEAKAQGGRCLECHIHPTFDSDLCILCGGCVDVCPSFCLRMVDAGRIDGDDVVVSALEAQFGKQDEFAGKGSLMLFDPLKCVRCGMCAQKCPTGACKMSVNTFTDTYIEA